MQRGGGRADDCVGEGPPAFAQGGPQEVTHTALRNSACPPVMGHPLGQHLRLRVGLGGQGPGVNTAVLNGKRKSVPVHSFPKKSPRTLHVFGGGRLTIGDWRLVVVGGGG